jgi:hypothetical protein
MTVVAIIGSKALLLLYIWLASAILCSYLSARKGFGERPGLATGMLLSLLGVIVWLVVPARAGSIWKTSGIRGRPKPSDAEPEPAAAEAADS